jgi:hypothetical protein
MTSRTLTKCDGPGCQRERDSTIHANTWIKMVSNLKAFDFCSYHCLLEWLKQHFFTWS